ncbi:hypothetical protein FRC03_008189, partial [Tulasnella sp. 419]
MSVLTPVHPNTRHSPMALPMPGKDMYDVELIVDSRLRRTKARKGAKSRLVLEYKVRWLGYGEEDDTWEPVKNLTGAVDAIAEFHEEHPEKPSPNDISPPSAKKQKQQNTPVIKDEEILVESPEEVLSSPEEVPIVKKGYTKEELDSEFERITTQSNEVSTLSDAARERIMLDRNLAEFQQQLDVQEERFREARAREQYFNEVEAEQDRLARQGEIPVFNRLGLETMIPETPSLPRTTPESEDQGDHSRRGIWSRLKNRQRSLPSSSGYLSPASGEAEVLPEDPLVKYFYNLKYELSRDIELSRGVMSRACDMLHAILRQEQAYFDARSSGEATEDMIRQ